MKPSSKNENEHIMTLTVYPKWERDASNSCPYDVKLYQTDANGKTTAVNDGTTIVDTIGCGADGSKKGRVDFSRIVLQLKRPFMKSSQKNISMGWAMKYIMLVEADAEYYDIVTDTYVTKRPGDMPTDEPASKKARSEDPPVPQSNERSSADANHEENDIGHGDGESDFD